ncbi:MAG: SDR family oxidoreductase [Methyloceanibacter sp.]|nr:SDR family oxidoreductase [Methyloceanibacter sp.]
MGGRASEQVAGPNDQRSSLRLRVLVLGGTGLIGSAVSARLAAEGHDVVRLVRSVPAGQGSNRTIAADISKLTRPEDWHPYLDGVDAIVNCAGALQDGPRDSVAGVHRDGMAALFQACVPRQMRRIIQISAIGVDRPNPTAFSRTKLEGDRILAGLDLDWVILRPVVVIGRAAFGGSALLRALAALPFVPVPPDAKAFQTVQLDDLAETVSFFLRPDAPSKLTLEVAHSNLVQLADAAAAFRSWFGWLPAKAVPMPKLIERSLYALGDIASWLGWRSPLRSTARLEIERGAVGDPRDWIETTGAQPQSLQAALAAEPPSVQEKWFARLYLLKPLVIVVLALYWLVTGLIALGPGWGPAVAQMRESGAGAYAALPVALGALADILIGLGIAYRPSARLALWAAIGLSVIYLVLGTILAPALWVDPLGPMVKILPILVLTFVALATLEER